MSKESGIAVFSQESGDGVSAYSTAGIGLYGVDIFVEAKNGEQARELIAPEILLQFPLPVQRFQLHIQYIQFRLR